MEHDPICNDVLRAIRQIIRAVDLNSKKLVQKCGLTTPQMVVLRELAAGQLMGSQLARQISLSNATVTAIVDRMERRELVTRRRDTTDRRKVYISLTESGRNLLSNAPSSLQESFVRQLEQLEDWERSLILASMQRVATMMNAQDLEVSPVLESKASLAEGGLISSSA
jgi:DNA-binding MarR family transcriptional regulator